MFVVFFCLYNIYQLNLYIDKDSSYTAKVDGYPDYCVDIKEILNICCESSSQSDSNIQQQQDKDLNDFIVEELVSSHAETLVSIDITKL